MSERETERERERERERVQCESASKCKQAFRTIVGRLCTSPNLQRKCMTNPTCNTMCIVTAH